MVRSPIGTQLCLASLGSLRFAGLGSLGLRLGGLLGLAGLRLCLRLGFAGLRLLGLAGLWFLLGLARFGFGLGVVLHDRVDGQPLARACLVPADAIFLGSRFVELLYACHSFPL